MVAVAVIPVDPDEPITVHDLVIDDLAQARALLTPSPGYLELVNVGSLGCALLVLDERVMGGVTHLFNERATGLVSQHTPYQGYIVGNALLVGIGEDSDFADVPLEAVTIASQRSTT